MNNEIIEYGEIKRLNVLMVVAIWIGIFTLYLIIVGMTDFENSSIPGGVSVSGGVVLSVYFLSKSSGLEMGTRSQDFKEPQSDIKYLDEFLKD